MGKLKESEELLERSLAVRKKILLEDNFQVAATLVHLARLTLQKFTSDLKNVDSDVATYYLVRTKQLVNDSIRITEGILNSSSKDLNKLNTTSTTDRDKTAATAVLLQALEVVGLLEIGMKHMLVPGLVLLLRLPLEHMKHGSFKIDAVSVSDTCRLLIWPNTNLIDFRYTTLQVHFKNKFGKEQDYRPIEQALEKCISLYKEPHTRSLVSKIFRQDYLGCLKRLTDIIEMNHVVSQTMKLQELLGEAQQIMEELVEESNRKK
uniref:Uncharacterized protein n=1 Tax=Arundo donax TaxID=35708 RepID=A0A0A9G518_ARUDO